MTPDSQDRATTLQADAFLIGILLLGIVCGMHSSPYFDPFFILLKPVLVQFYVTSPLLVFYFTSIILSTLAIMIGGVPTAFFERITKRQESDSTSRFIWLITMFIIAIPAIAGLASGRQ